MDLQSPAGRRKLNIRSAKSRSPAITEMQKRNSPGNANKTSWSKQSSVLLVNIVKEVEKKILKKELLVGKENETTKWDCVAGFLHEASPRDASKTPNICQYKFWELNRHYKFLLKESAAGNRMSLNEAIDGPIFAALKAYYGNSPPVEKKGKLQRRIALFKESETQQKTENPTQVIGNPSLSAPMAYNDGGSESEDLAEDGSGGSLRHSSHRDSVENLAASDQGVEQFEDNAGSPLHNPNVDVVEQLRRSRGRPKGSKRKAIDPGNRDSEVALKEKANSSSNRLKQIVGKMARLTSYMKWKQTGVGEDWRCALTDRIERRQKRGMRNLVKNANQPQAEEMETEVPDEIEAALREDILSCWNELDNKRPSAAECQKYYLKKCAGEVYW
ncbi:unnamed protein product [Calypogeia fissa]